MERRFVGRARVRVTLEIEVPDTWGGDCTLAQAHAQARKSASEFLLSLAPRPLACGCQCHQKGIPPGMIAIDAIEPIVMVRSVDAG